MQEINFTLPAMQILWVTEDVKGLRLKVNGKIHNPIKNLCENHMIVLDFIILQIFFTKKGEKEIEKQMTWERKEYKRKE